MIPIYLAIHPVTTLLALKLVDLILVVELDGVVPHIRKHGPRDADVTRVRPVYAGHPRLRKFAVGDGKVVGGDDPEGTGSSEVAVDGAVARGVAKGSYGYDVQRFKDKLWTQIFHFINDTSCFQSSTAFAV